MGWPSGNQFTVCELVVFTIESNMFTEKKTANVAPSWSKLLNSTKNSEYTDLVTLCADM